MCYELLLHLIVPETCISEVLEQVMVHHLEFPGQHSARVDVAGVRLDGLVVPKNLCSGRCGHGRQEETVPNAMSEKDKRNMDTFQYQLFLKFKSYCAIFSLRAAQSHRSVGVTPHISYCSCPLLTGEPSYVSYGPSSWASSQEAVSAA